MMNAKESIRQLKNIAWHKYLVSCLNVCDALHGKPEWNEKYAEAKQELKINRDKWQFLSRNEQMKLKLFMFSAPLYKVVIRLYEKYFQKKIYE